MTSPAIALCLSGGGLRATLFHFGLLKALRAYQKEGVNALAAVAEIYAVSGGSIAAAHLARYWGRYTDGDDQTFAAVQSEIIRFAGSNVRDRVIRRWLLFRWTFRRRAWWLQRHYEHLLGPGAIGNCYSGNPATDPPLLHVLATSFRTGELCSFSPSEFEIEPGDAGGFRMSVPGSHLKLAHAVAASSAFPPLFPPVALTYEALRRPKNNEVRNGLHLSDGGVYDNLGYEKFDCNQKRGALPPDLLIVSNAGGAFETSHEKTYSNILSRNVRASDILMRRVSENTRIAAQRSKCVEIAIDTIAARSPVPAGTQQLLRLVRTDLDAFSPELAGMLIDHGYRVAAEALREKGWVAVGQPAWCVTGLTDAEQSDTAMNAADRTFWSWVKSFWLDWRDWTSPVLCALLVLASATAGSVIYGAWQTLEAQRQARDAKEAQLLAREQAAIRQAKANAEERRRLNSQAALLEPIRRAAAARDIEAVRTLLAGAIVASERAAGSTSKEPGGTTRAPPVGLAPVSAAETARIIDEAPDYTVQRSDVPRRERVYIQFAGNLSRAQITALNAALREANWRTQGASGERTPRADGLNEVRYSGDNAAAAGDLAAAIDATGVVQGRVIAKPVPAIGPDVLEVWISR